MRAAREQRLEGGARPLFGARIFQQAGGMVVGEHDAVEIVRELIGVDAGAEMTIADGAPDGRGNRLEPVGLQQPTSRSRAGPSRLSSSAAAWTNMQPPGVR